MEAVFETILARRSVRKYLETPVPQETLEKIINASLYAPSGANRQPWHVAVITNPALIAKVNAEMKAAVARDESNRDRERVSADGYHVSLGAPVLVIVSVDMTLAATGKEDASLLLGTMFLAAHALGVGTCWINQLKGLNDEVLFRQFLGELGVPVGNTIIGAAAIGYAAGPLNPAPPRREGTVTYIS